LLGRTPNCGTCTFVVQEVVESIVDSGTGTCPSCGAIVVLKELQFDHQMPEAETGMGLDEASDSGRARALGGTIAHVDGSVTSGVGLD
jgi:hypothetical protein